MTAIYHYRQYFEGHLIPQKCLVEILKNDNKTYLVKTLQYISGHELGKVIRVHKKNISFKTIN